MTQEKLHWHLSGIAAWLGLFVLLAIIVFSIASIANIISGFATLSIKDPSLLYLLVAVLVVSCWLLGGFTVIQPNEALVLVFVGNYNGTVKNNGLVLVNPLCSRKRISLKLQNLHSDILKVNDKKGNPIEIGAVIVWQVAEPSKAIFDVDNYAFFVKIQSEAAVRHLASSYAYDSDDDQHTLRSSIDEVSQALRDELNQRLAIAGISIREARIAHLAYAPEIANAMLKRQQAEAIISARRAIVTGAVNIVSDALKELTAAQVVNLDDERRAAMVSNLLVVLCSDTQAQPIVNAGSLY